MVFFEDILIYSPTWKIHLSQLELVLQLLRKESLYAKLSKCSFDTNEIDYLGHTINGVGVHMDKEKVQAVSNWQIPTTCKKL